VKTYELHPIGDQLDIWVRNECERDGPGVHEPNERVDTDFVLNYLLRKDVPAFLKAMGSKLPMPRVATSWLFGGGIGGDRVQCMRVSEKAKTYARPG
jgi:hypothetical protein